VFGVKGFGVSGVPPPVFHMPPPPPPPRDDLGDCPPERGDINPCSKLGQGGHLDRQVEYKRYLKLRTRTASRKVLCS
jgi:hypothetical protein